MGLPNKIGSLSAKTAGGGGGGVGGTMSSAFFLQEAMNMVMINIKAAIRFMAER